MQSLTMTIITHGVPLDRIYDGTQLRTPTKIGDITTIAASATKKKKTGTTDTPHKMKVQCIGLKVRRLHQLRVH